MIRLKNNHWSRVSLITLVVLLFSACEGRPKGVINQNDMISILADLHQTDASMAAKGIGYDQFDIKNNYYCSILKKYDVTQAEFDSSLLWYSKNPKKFERIYDEVIVRLTNLQTDIQAGKYHKIDSSELAYNNQIIWENKTKYILTKDSARTHLDFEIKNQSLMFGDIYILKFTQQIAREDSCVQPFIRVQINYENGKTIAITQRTCNNNIKRRYTFRLPAIYPSKIKSITGQLLGSKTYKGKQNSITDSISLIQRFNPSKQDSLLRILQKSDPKNYPTYDTPPTSKTVAPIRNLRSLILRKQ